MSADKSDTALVQEAAGGDRDAMERLLARAKRTAYRFSLRVCGQPQDAEDVTQDALLKTFTSVDRLSAPEAFRSWLYTMVRNACLMKRRRRAGEPAQLVPIDAVGSEFGERGLDLPDLGPGPDEQAIDAHAAERLRQAIRALPRDYRTVLRLRDVQGLSTRDVAAREGISEDAVKTRLHRARAMLKRSLNIEIL